MSDIVPKITIDCVGLYCPQPIFEIKVALNSVKIGEIIEMTADDPGSESDLKSFTKRAGHSLLIIDELGNGIKRFIIKREK